MTYLAKVEKWTQILFIYFQIILSWYDSHLQIN